jgi:hypothetical protein
MVIRDEHNAYKLEDGVLLCAAITNDGRVEEDNWYEVDFYRIDANEKAYCKAIQSVIELTPVY